MNKKKLIKTLVTVLPVFLVPLITERKRIKSHPEVKKVTDATNKATKAVVNTSADVKDYLVDKKDALEEKREIKKIERANDPAHIQAQIEKEQKAQHKEAEKMRHKLEKNIATRHKEEEKLRKQLQKQRIKSMKNAEKAAQANNVDASKANKAEIQAEALANDAEVQAMAERLNTRIDERHAAEALLREQNLQSRVKTFEAYIHPEQQQNASKK